MRELIFLLLCIAFAVTVCFGVQDYKQSSNPLSTTKTVYQAERVFISGYGSITYIDQTGAVQETYEQDSIKVIYDQPENQLDVINEFCHDADGGGTSCHAEIHVHDVSDINPGVTMPMKNRPARQLIEP